MNRRRRAPFTDIACTGWAARTLSSRSATTSPTFTSRCMPTERAPTRCSQRSDRRRQRLHCRTEEYNPTAGDKPLSMASRCRRLPGGPTRSNAQFCSVPPESMTFGLAPLPCGEATTSFGPGVNGVVLSPPELFSDHPASVLSITNGVLGTAQLSLTENDGRALTLLVSVDAGHAVPIQLGLGLDGRVAAAIFDSIRLTASSSPADGRRDRRNLARGLDRRIRALVGRRASLHVPDNHVERFRRLQFDRRPLPGGPRRRVSCRRPRRNTHRLPSGRTVPIAHVLMSATHVDLVDDSLTFLDGNDGVLGRFERARPTTSTTARTG